MCQLCPEARLKKAEPSQVLFLAWVGFWPGLWFLKAKAAGLSPGFGNIYVIFLCFQKTNLLIFYNYHVTVWRNLPTWSDTPPWSPTISPRHTWKLDNDKFELYNSSFAMSPLEVVWLWVISLPHHHHFPANTEAMKLEKGYTVVTVHH